MLIVKYVISKVLSYEYLIFWLPLVVTMMLIVTNGRQQWPGSVLFTCIISLCPYNNIMRKAPLICPFSRHKK